MRGRLCAFCHIKLIHSTIKYKEKNRCNIPTKTIATTFKLTIIDDGCVGEHDGGGDSGYVGEDRGGVSESGGRNDAIVIMLAVMMMFAVLIIVVMMMVMVRMME